MAFVYSSPSTRPKVGEVKVGEVKVGEVKVEYVNRSVFYNRTR